MQIGGQQDIVISSEPAVAEAAQEESAPVAEESVPEPEPVPEVQPAASAEPPQVGM